MTKHTIAGTLLAAVITAGMAMQAQAHRAWILPSSTVLSGEDPYVTFDAAISNTLFFPDHFPMGVDDVKATAPDGRAIALENASEGRYRSTFDLQLKREGTYKIARASAGLRAFWKDDEGQRHRWPGRGQRADDSEFATEVPEDARDLRVFRGSRRVETFVTVGNPSDDVFAPEGAGLELVPVTHPNDLFAGEAAQFKFLIDGEAAAGAKAILIPGGSRYRNSQDEIEVTADEAGLISVTWPTAGQYFMEVEYEDDKAAPPATSRRGQYSATFEVLPL